ncbi:hypothetical protein TBLA_0C05620 [Henningerozyma blattae CBS 6284]|uniref:t-SNARE coiled-coil homology domain-containing protein n=1 Tax=Henningerozyma blattae (strain ATCC 34711 / CBS 6284 / DSM 70876 / NBRC 10599 / NRRL Y-10934 / UCD 77-7) TaxID=1071380 RepID=I2H1V8_HENB6|nr:hypothetical protein TBLA_0C05620 [Tetrapisispora blattae CBS 6284]CCH60360.1 hypothetical protein TBLA_0C05620 [Tetrapisispora blattae CBS 6284]
MSYDIGAHVNLNTTSSEDESHYHSKTNDSFSSSNNHTNEFKVGYNEVTENIETLAHNINNLKRKINIASASTDIGKNINANASIKSELEIDNLFKQSNDIENFVNLNINRLINLANFNNLKNDFKILKNDLKSLNLEWTKIKNLQIKLRKQLENQKPIKKTVVSTTTTTDGNGYVSMNINEETPLIRSDSQRQLLQQTEADPILQQELDYQTIIETERAAEISRIHHNVGEVNAIFKQLGSLVTQQGEQIDTIEGNIGQLRDNAEAANTQLLQAENHQRSRMRCSIWVLIILFFVILFMLLLA